ncbi:YciI family protein [Kineococcus sp. SYSU DK003]|uniref:YciI family protein n=1 Tax=Kineococcus sp. SYSU DK003 TaxID=3383124 RepID=UPI003D7E9E64
MPYFVVTYTYSPDTETRNAVRPAHREWLAAQDSLLLSGPTDADGAFLVFEGADAAAVEELLDADPFATDGRVIAGRSVVGWTPVLGRLTSAL